VGGDRIESLKEIVEKMMLAVEKDDFYEASVLSKELLGIDVSSLSKEEAENLSKTISMFIKKAKSRELDIINALEKKKQAKRFLK